MAIFLTGSTGYIGAHVAANLLEEHGASVTAGHPYPCDAAALHHVLDGGWMWVLRFDNGVTSAGFSLDPEVHPMRADETPEQEWARLLGTYPSLARQFAAHRWSWRWWVRWPPWA